MYDIAIIGAGISGSAIARELSKYKAKVLVLDKENDVGNVTFLIMNAGSKVNIIGEFDYVLDNDMVYYRASDFVHRFNAMDCVATLFIDPDTRTVYSKRNVQMLNVVDPDFFFSKDFFRLNLEMDMFGKAFHGVFSGVLSDVDGIALVDAAIEQYNNEMYEESENFMN